ncbi:MAG: GNAT family N-acetyltransferase [Candidatus Abyssobacteria bacterium SURF_5]|uniref:GNAT family N-acetyltransferase n=1 Tax=Abyssobacteria bacterium (strain SURF_5) TaxID=2093360 RepID=A0A3A4PAT1_ABYX5|nr:MAG: GNAT family N-acetyltransferase [Candidatus Abyssubacteria bacterium SURF_5]
MEFVPITEKDYGRIADLHQTCYPGDFLPSFGYRFLVALYDAMFKADAVFGFVGKEDGEIVGFSLCTADADRLFPATLRKGLLKLAWLAGLRLLQKPSILKKLFETFLYKSRASLEEVNAEMMLWAIDPKCRGRGLGTELWEACERELLKKRIERYKVTVYADNKPANSFYRKKGFRLVREFVLYGKKWNLYVGRIAPDSFLRLTKQTS